MIKEPEWMAGIRADYPKAIEDVDVFGYPRLENCQEGWRDLIRWALAKMVAADPEVRIVRIERVEGTLRIYSRTTSQAARRVSQEAKDLSARVCEYCGLPGRLYTNRPGPVTCCPECAEF